jgi:hypothetical protein
MRAVRQCVTAFHPPQGQLSSPWRSSWQRFRSSRTTSSTWMTPVLTLSFAPGPTFTQGKCPKGYHWQFNPSNDGSGACYLTGPPPKP